MAPGVGIYCDSDEKDLLRGGERGQWTITGKMVQEAGLSMRDDQMANVIYQGNFATGQDKLRLPTGSLTALCQWGLPEGYISDDLFGQIYDGEAWVRPLNSSAKKDLDDDEITEPNANLILILYDNIQDEQGVRGIALCHVDETHSKLLVLGANRPGSDIRNRVFATGGMLLRLVQYLFSKLAYIDLYALETVISLYYHFGWRFIDEANCSPKKPGGKVERPKYSDAVANLKALLKKNPTEENLTSALSAFRGFAAKRAELIRIGKAVDDDGVKIATQEARENGYRMILCKIDNPYYKKQGGGKRFARRQKAGALIDTNVGEENEGEEGEKIFNSSVGTIDKIEKLQLWCTNMIQAKKSKRGGKRRTKKRALRKKHRGRKTKGKKKKNKKWCKSTKKWCKYTKKNNCKKGLWKKKTKLGRASRKWCKSTKKWCRVRKKACKKRR